MTSLFLSKEQLAVEFGRVAFLVEQGDISPENAAALKRQLIMTPVQQPTPPPA